MLLVYGLAGLPALGIRGSALGTVVAQTGTAVALLAVVVRAARAHRVPLLPDPAGIRSASGAGVPLLLHTVTLRG